MQAELASGVVNRQREVRLRNMVPSILKTRLPYLLLVILVVFAGRPALAQIKGGGHCADCHTMHNSQNGAKMVYVGSSALPADWAGWNGSVLQGGDAIVDPQPSLLVSDCVGCHTSTTAETIVTKNNLRIPIVFNTTTPTNPLAGGNFYWVALAGGDAYGHNVRGISAKDVALTAGAPGAMACGDANNCHESLTYADADSNHKNGCQGCHQSVKHHGPSAAAGDPASASEGYYRFLNGPPGHEFAGGAGVHGIEDPDWEQTPDASNHNTYYGGVTDPLDQMEAPQSMGQFCAGCHVSFHSPGFETYLGIDNGGGADGDPWFRHPTDVAIPATGEYRNYTVYSPTVPVARPAPLTSASANVVTPGTDKVFCLSCHRAHGSPNPDMLRWAYSGMEPGTVGTSAGTGCFICHSYKDDKLDAIPF